MTIAQFAWLKHKDSGERQQVPIVDAKAADPRVYDVEFIDAGPGPVEVFPVDPTTMPDGRAFDVRSAPLHIIPPAQGVATEPDDRRIARVEQLLSGTEIPQQAKEKAEEAHKAVTEAHAASRQAEIDRLGGKPKQREGEAQPEGATPLMAAQPLRTEGQAGG